MFCVWTHLLSDLQGSLAQRLRLLVLASLPVQDRQVIEGGGNLTGAQATFHHQTIRPSGVWARLPLIHQEGHAGTGSDFNEPSFKVKLNAESTKYVDGRNEKNLEVTSHL